MPVHNADIAAVFTEIADAHSRSEFADLRYGVGQARRDWLEEADVLNTRTLAQLRPLLARTMRIPAAA